ncbi:MAG: histidine kinase N-terminal 7TM domain-containing protein [Anaerolineales bacterium]|jgi:PAS domain S-box-containing protein
MAIGIVLFTIAVAVTIAILVLRKRKVRGATSLIVFSFALTIWACAYGFLLIDLPSSGRIWLAVVYLSATVTSTALLTFILAYTNHEEWLGKWGIILLCLEPLATQILFWTNYWQGFSTGYKLTNTGIVLASSPWYWINASYSDGLLILAFILLTQTFLHKSKQYMLQSMTIVIGIFIPILTKILSLAVFALILNLEPPLISFAITGLLLVYSVSHFKLLDIAPIARDDVIENMSDGWMVLDRNNRIVDMNPAAEALVRVSREQAFGKPAEDILQNWPKLDQEPSVRELEIKGSVRLHGELRYLSVRILPLVRSPEQLVGKVVLWRDITDHRMSDNARQRARDEMFVLLHSISSLAFRTLSLNDFLAETSSQIMYSFQSQASLIILLEETHSKAGEPKYYLAAHQGIAQNKLGHLSSSPEVARIVAQILESKEPFFVPDVSTDPRLPPTMQQSGNKSLLMLPLTTGEQILGVIGLIRKSGLPYGKDEITRLSIVAEELASFISSGRQRQLAIALEERQRLVHDLHDSISQKLYGLVTLTEAAQASLETGSTVQAAELSRIGENARQALKEMRLFLFQMKPVDLEHAGLVAALHERLAAVEGRADIKARLLADDDIDLSLEKETMLYYIAQEALNNIMKHANASSVTILLKKRKASVSLEVMDDGCGFDPKITGKGGMGLRIMQERVAKIDGKLFIKSVPGKGTKIIVTVGNSKAPHAVKSEENNE